jgi:DNA invertase Pin-like site-specific DNA recombinase
LHQQNVDTSTPVGEAMFAMMGVFSQFERAMIRERVLSGLARARAEGRRLGRPPISERTKERVWAARAAGKSIRQIAREVGIGIGTVAGIVVKPE